MPVSIRRKLDFVNSEGGFCAGVDFVETGFCDSGFCAGVHFVPPGVDGVEALNADSDHGDHRHSVLRHRHKSHHIRVPKITGVLW